MRAWIRDYDAPQPGQNWCWTEDCRHMHYPAPLNFKSGPVGSEERLYEWIVTCPVCSPEEYEYRKAVPR